MSGKKSKSISTELQLRRLPLSSKRYDVKIANVSGLVARIGRSKSFRWDRGAGNRPRIVTYGKFPDISLKQARDRHEKARERHSQGIIGEIDATAPKIVSELAEVFYSDRILPTRRRPEIVRQVLDHDVIPSIGKLKLTAVNTLAVRRTVKVMVDRGAKSHAARCLAIMKQMFRFAVAIGVMDSNPAEPLDKADLGAGENRRDRVLSADDIRQLWGAMETHPRFPMHVRIGLQLLILLGARSGELRQAQWQHLDTEAMTLTVPVENQKVNPRQKKNAKPFVVPIDRFALDLFEQLRGLDPLWIFPSKTGVMKSTVFSMQVRRLLDGDLDIEKFVPHDLRRTMRTNLSKLKIPPHVAELCLNHSLGTIIDTYDQHSYLDERREALEFWSQRVQVILGNHENVVIMEGVA
jgi:integrase